ncbi:EAL domain-containing protein [Cohnella yongneupensis]|uniref:EAL domain-containing protein n=1 Tax=Cohnella yongneupensis TaxID=425006 RepID=A0ABW0R1N4_9BACL
MMATEYRIGLIATHLDGEYYGRIIPDIHQHVRSKNSRLFAIQSSDENLGITRLEDPVAFHLIDAWILVLPAASSSFQELLNKSGKPVVGVGFQPPTLHAHSVVVSNHDSMRQAVLHLIDAHGHERIAFIGNLDQYDLYERYLGYRAALSERGISFDERLVIKTDDNLLEGGARATELLLSRHGGLGFTALVGGTDLNAIGAINALRESGYSVPGDAAIIGFDDIPQAATNYPSLTTVLQSFDALAKEVVKRVFTLLEGRPYESNLTYVPAHFKPRASCGCVDPALATTPEEIGKISQSLSQLRTSLHQITTNNYQMTRALIMATKAEKIHISNLFWNLAHWGCLALWETDKRGGRRLVVKQTFSKRGDTLPPIGEAYRLEEFPSLSYLPPTAQPGGEDMVILHRVMSEMQDWGYIALCTPLDPLNNFVANDLTRHSFSILAVAMERDMLVHQIRSFAEKLELVARTTNDGIWDWNLATNKIEWNARAHKLLSAASVTVTDAPRSFLAHIHPEDQAAVREAFRKTLTQKAPIQSEFRVVGAGGQQIWVYLAGDCIRDTMTGAVRIIGSLTDITEKKTNEARIIQMAYHDALTGLPNRTFFQERLRKTMVDRELGGGTMAVFMIDLDRFKIVNDTLGHQVGDSLLVRVANLLKECVSDKDLIARLGGDEFIVMLSSIESEEEVARVADLMLEKLSEPVVLEGTRFFLSASIGVSMYPSQGVDSETLIKFADLAMYQSKKNGGNRLGYYTENLSSQQVERVSLENGLRHALERGEFVLHYQPQISLATGKILGAEALIRWQMPGGRLVQPNEFIPFAEESGLIIPIGQWVLEQACVACKQWIADGMLLAVISVNISSQQFQRGDFPELVRQVLRNTGIQPYNLCLEITEHMAVMNMEHSIQVLNELVEIGVKIAIDDFGIGQSSLILLKRLPVHTVKIDPSFIFHMTDDAADAAIAKGIIDMSHGLGLSVTAEGVETEEQIFHLQQLGCDRIQGYYTGRPMSSEQFIGYFQQTVSGTSRWGT